MHPTIRLWTLACILLPWTAPATAAEPGPPLADLLSQDTAFYFEADARALTEGVRKLDLVRLLSDPEMKDFLAPLVEQFEFLSAEDPVGSLWSSLPIHDMVAGEVAFGLAGVGFEIVNPDGSRETLRISASHPLSARLNRLLSVYEVHYNGDGAAETHGAPPFERLAVDFLLRLQPGPALKQIVRDWLAAPPGFVEVGSIPMAGRSVTAVQFAVPDVPDMHATLYADLDGDTWLIGGDAESFARALAGTQPRPLSQSAPYRAFRERLVSGRAVLLSYLDLANALSALRTLVPPLVMEEMELAGLSAFRGVGVGVSMTEGSVRESLLLGFDGDASGLFSTLQSMGGGFASLREAPASTLAYLGLRFDAAVLKDRILDAVGQLAPRVRPYLEDQLAAAMANGFNFIQEILPAFGGEVSVSVGAPRSGWIPEALLTLEVRDPVKFERLLDYAREHLPQEAQVQISDMALKDGAPGFVVRIPDSPVQPAFALRGDRLLGSLSALSLKSYLAGHVENASAPRLGQSEVMKRVLNGLLNGNDDALAGLFYLDLHSTIPALYGTAAPYLQQVFDESGLPLDVTLLPLPETLQPYFSGLALGVTRDEGGLGIHLFSPIGVLPAGVTAAAATLAVEHAQGHGHTVGPH